MKLAILLARSSVDSSRASVVHAPMPYDQAAKIYKEHVARREMPDGCAKAGLNVLEIWTSDGRRKSKRLADLGATPAASAPAPAPAKAAKPAKPAPESPAPAPAPAASGDLVTKMAARLSAGEAVTPADLEVLGEDQLRALAAGFAIEIPDGSGKDDIITLILASD